MASKCGQMSCKCVDSSDEGYCSESCAQQAENPSPGQACECGHPNCR
jgi:hypothetical protein